MKKYKVTVNSLQGERFGELPCIEATHQLEAADLACAFIKFPEYLDVVVYVTDLETNLALRFVAHKT